MSTYEETIKKAVARLMTPNDQEGLEVWALDLRFYHPVWQADIHAVAVVTKQVDE